ncbi:MAG TPA: hypothetical protein VGC21_11515 [Telluria sp.]|jgi:hypothetical protein
MRDLLNDLHDTGSEDTPEDAVIKAIKFWLAAGRRLPGQVADRSGPDANPVTPERDSSHAKLRGYQWKWLFLPEGTRARIYCHAEHGEAVVVGDHLTLRGKKISPNQFACSAARGMRNAWRDLSLLLPGEKFWKPASLRRFEYRRAKLATANGPERRGERMQLVTLADIDRFG